MSVTNPAIGSCPTMPTTSARSRGRYSLVSRPLTSTRPASVPPVKCGTSPLIARSNVDLPDPVRPITSASSPSGTVKLTSRSAGSAAPSYVTVTRSNSIMRPPA